MNHHPNNDARRLLRCHYCNEWFNTTDYIFAKHLLKHRHELPSGMAQIMEEFVMMEDWLRGARKSLRELP